MLNRCKKKLNSRRGASFLLALLFFLVCGLVASSVLMAASSNAGRSRSSREEHQTYLTISSAVRLLCDELNAAEYRGRYHYWEVPVYGPDEEGKRIQIGVERHLEQLEGLYQYTDGSGAAALKENLLDDFDYIFSQEFVSVGAGINTSTRSGLTPPVEHTFTIQPEESNTDLDTRPVTVELRVVEDSYAIELTAALDQGDGKPDYVVRAELTPNETKPTLPETFSSDTTAETSPMTWRVGWIIPGAAEEEEAASGG